MKKNMKVLVVDDNKEGRLLLSKILTSNNYDVTEACNGIEALECLKTLKPDLIISDILMPVMDGFTLIRELNKDSSGGKIPVVLYSAQYVNEKDKELAEKLGALRFITKPAEPKDILEEIKLALAEFESAETNNFKSHISKDEEYLGEYAERVFRKLEDKVKELEKEITRSKRAEEALKSSEEKYRDLFENANDAICIVDSDLKYLDANTKLLELTGYSKEEILRMSIFDLIPSEQASRSNEAIKKLQKKGHYEKFIGKIVTKSGNLIDIEVNSSAIIEDGRIVGSRDIIREITERKKAEDVLRERERLYHSLVEGIPGIVYSFSDRRGGIYYSSHVEDILGYSPEYLLAHPMLWHDSIHRDDRSLVDDIIRQLPSRQSFNIEYRIRDAKGNWRWFEDIFIEQKRDSSDLILTGLAMDITERKRADEALRESEARFQSILDNSSTVVFLKDLEGRYIMVNRRYEELFHVTRQTVVSKSDYDIFPREHADRFRQHDLLALEKGSPFEVEEFVPHDDGQHVYISVKFPLFTAEKKPYAVCGIATDITERKRAEEKIQRRSEDFASLFNISRTLAEAPDLKTVLQKTTDSITELMRQKRAAIYILEGDSIYLRATTPPLDPQMPDSFRRAKLSDHPHIRESMYTCKPVLLPDTLQADLTLAERDISEALGLRTVLYLPLIVEGNAVGTLNVAAVGEPRDISNAEIDMCYTMANLAALNIQKAQLYESIQHYAADLQCQVAERKHAEEKIEKSLKEKEILLREIHHRVKNNMQIISSLLGLASETIKDKKYVDMFRESQNRINSMSLIHERLYRSKDLEKIELNEYFKDLAHAIFQSRGVIPGTIVLKLNIGNVQLGIDHSIPLGLIINELITNSLKYAFPGDRKGEINVILHLIDQKTFELIVSDNGVGIPCDMDFRKTESLGLRLVTLLVENQLKGNIYLDRSKGTEFNIKFKGMQ